MTTLELLAAAQAHRDRCVARYGEGSYQAKLAERAVEVIEGRG